MIAWDYNIGNYLPPGQTASTTAKPCTCWQTTAGPCEAMFHLAPPPPGIPVSGRNRREKRRAKKLKKIIAKKVK